LTAVSTGRARGIVALALLVTLVIALVLTLVLVLRLRDLTDEPFSWSNAGEEIFSESEKQAAITAAEQFALRMDGFDGDDPAGWRKSVAETLTAKFKADFEKSYAQIEELGIQKGQSGKGKIQSAGLSELDADSATVLVAHDIAITSSAGTGTQTSRWSVTLDKVGGKWLVDNFEQVS
jgi:hypothetical protein